MKKWLKRIRGAVGTGLTWAAAWGLVGPLLLSLATGVLSGGQQFAIPWLSSVLNFAASGLVGGGAFSVLLGLAEGRRTFDEMSLPRFASWGALAAMPICGTVLVLSEVTWISGILGMVAITALLGAGSASASLALARMADDGELLKAGADVAEVGLTQEEKRALLGG